MTALKPLVKCGTVLLPGDHVELLDNTPAPANDVLKIWTVRSCDCLGCRGGRLVCVDQRTLADDAWRHITRSRLRLARLS